MSSSFVSLIGSNFLFNYIHSIDDSSFQRKNTTNIIHQLLEILIQIYQRRVANKTIKMIKSMTKRIISMIQHQHGHRQPLYARQQTISSSFVGLLVLI
jgi:hypothetical protein